LSVPVVITGEGRLDEQTLHGKAPAGVAAAAVQAGVPVVAVSGGRDLDDARLTPPVHRGLCVDRHRADVQRCIDEPVPLLERLAGSSPRNSSGPMTRLNEQRRAAVVEAAAVTSSAGCLAPGLHELLPDSGVAAAWAVQGGASRATAGLVTTVMLVTTVVTQALVAGDDHPPGQRAGAGARAAPAWCASPLYAVGASPLLARRLAIRGTGFALSRDRRDADLRCARRNGMAKSVGLYGLAIAVPNLVGVPAGVALTQAGHFGVAARTCRQPGAGSSVRAPGRSPTHADADAAAELDAVSHRLVLMVALAPSFVLLW